MEKNEIKQDQMVEYNIRDLFYHQHGLDLFEESNLKLNLLLRDSFRGLTFHDWYQWRPYSSLYNKNDNIWIIQIELSSIPKLIENWLQQEKLNIMNEIYKYLYLEVIFFNFIDLPIIQSWKYINKIIISPSLSPKLSSLPSLSSLPLKSYKKFCLKNEKMEKLTKETKKIIKETIKLHDAKWFFKEGFYIAPSTITKARFGLFSLNYIQPGTYLCLFEGKRMSPYEFQDIPLYKRLLLEEYAFETSFFKDDKKTNDPENIINFVFDPTNDNNQLTIEDMSTYPNPGAWINEPPLGSVSNVFMQSFTNFNLPLENTNRYVLHVISARTIYPYDELFLHYEGNYFRKDYTPGEKCPDLLD